MNKSLVQLGQQLPAIWRKLGLKQRVSIVVAGLAVFGCLSGIVAGSNRVEYAILLGDLGDAEVVKAVAALDEAKVDYRVRNGSILVPADQVHRLRMQLVSKGIPGRQKTGFSLFDKPNFGISDFEQRLNYTRAFQNDLSSTIGKVEGIDGAEVLLVIPESGPNVEYPKKASASVFIKLHGNAPVPASTVHAIRFLVAHSIDGLEPAAVSITDNLGHILTNPLDSASIDEAGTPPVQPVNEPGGIPGGHLVSDSSPSSSRP